MKIRFVAIEDASGLVNLYQQLDSETTFMLFEPRERNADVEVQKVQLEQFINSQSQTMLVVESNVDEIVGFVVGIGGKVMRTKHSLYCVLGVAKSHWGKGLGKELLNSLEVWARDKQFRRIELTVMEHNQAAINLYKRCGFEIEGTKRNSIKINGQLLNEFYMGKLLEP